MHPTPSRLETHRMPDGALVAEVGGDWSTRSPMPSGLGEALAEIADLPADGKVQVVPAGLGQWDTSLVSVLQRIADVARDRGVALEVHALPQGIQRLLSLATAVPEKEDARRGAGDIGIIESIGRAAIGTGAGIRETVTFVGEIVIALTRVLTGRGIFRWGDLLTFLRRAGIEALGISVLVATLLGLILAFISAVQFVQYGAEIYVADLVGIGMVRDLGALMTAIVMAGRSGAAYAAEIGSMRATQELDALETAGISPIEFLVVPRILALALMMPLLTAFADIAGILGGAVVGIGMLDISPTFYLDETLRAVQAAHLYGGLIKGFFYGILVGVAGCLRGIQSGASSLAVGAAATSAVVTGLVWLIAACGLFQALQYLLQIP
jgi:phospholipid/cholesterol/gamma-HCH transport system permease protein